jgi:hypothetical protein
MVGRVMVDLLYRYAQSGRGMLLRALRFSESGLNLVGIGQAVKSNCSCA